MKCDCCGVREATTKDYRFIERYGFQGKTFVCDICFNLDDVSFVDVNRVYGTEEAFEELRSIIIPESWEKYGLEDVDEEEGN